MKYIIPTILVAIVLGVAVLAFAQKTQVKTEEVLETMTISNSSSENLKLKTGSDHLYVKLYNKEGELVGPVRVPEVVKTKEEWQEILTDEQYNILRDAGTERAGTGSLLKNKERGIYVSAATGLPLFHSDSKFESGTGWPSFYAPISDENIGYHVDRSFGMARTEVLDPLSGSHLGHVFTDGPQPTGLRYCMNSAALRFVPEAEIASELGQENLAVVKTRDIVIAGGCFWCVEGVFEELDGVIHAVSGYAGDSEANADYKLVSAGRTEHAEAVQLTFDPAVISYEDLLRVHFATHDPTTLNRQGNDVGKQYRSAIFYSSEEEKQTAQRVIDELNASGIYEGEIVTTLEPLEKFYEAEQYHQNYSVLNPSNPYVRGVSLPKVEKLRKYLDKINP